ncbi:hypothetical protein CTM53_09255 [Prevotella intermedia]|uniref:Uncharacterized protein n=1 Tax=Prevotella intermedia TaxID=28131 RepID=A0AAJ3VCJ6_PREIN|nr:hypothetical protein CTM61_11775 [Prevotella intermedia]PJI18807.1 hypothetical protein CTM53_09255 [Prevotella intermedia]
MTAKENFVQQFTGWNQGGMFCRFMKGYGLYGQAKEHYDIWTDDERALGRKSRQAVCRLSLTSLLPRVRRRSASLQARRCIRSGDWRI